MFSYLNPETVRDVLVQALLDAPVWGVRPILYREPEVSYEALTAFGKSCVLQHEAGRPGDSVVVTAGVPFHTSGSTNTMRVEQL